MSNRWKIAEWSDPTADPLVRYHACKAMARGYSEDCKSEEDRLGHARAFCASAIHSFWFSLCDQNRATLKIKPLKIPLDTIPEDVSRVAEDVGRLVASFPVEDAGYLIGSIYTVMLPQSLRSEMGAYYTPPPLVSRLLDMAEAAGFDCSCGTAIDPACGGGAFLAPLALRMVSKCGDASPEWVVRHLGRRLKGLELDPFAAWMTGVLLDAALLPLYIKTGCRIRDVVEVGDALHPKERGQFDLVIGNPPYGRVNLDQEMRNHYARSLYGHANLYGLFTDLALRLIKANGVLAYLTPTSFLGGQYFKSLRHLLSTEVTPMAFDLLADREGVFDDVLQETLLATYVKADIDVPAKVSLLVPHGLNAAHIEQIGSIRASKQGDPWLLPRHRDDADFLDRIDRMTTRLSDLGYSVSTGPLVWNRHKDQLRKTANGSTYPLIWAETVTGEGFSFTAQRRNHVPYIQVYNGQSHLITKRECVLVQRTTSKEQDRRLMAAVVPQSFLDTHDGAVFENHLNMVQPSPDKAVVKPETIAALLNTKVVDRAFRCISGSVAVSAYELNALPLPSRDQLCDLERLIGRRATRATIDRRVASYYEDN